MTFADDLPFEEEQKEESAYPTIFGITVTPIAGGIACAVAGVIGAAALGWYVVRPAMEGLTALETQIDDTEAQIIEQERLKAQIGQLRTELAQVQSNQQEILGLFSTEDQLNTLLLDINRQVEGREGQLVNFDPQAGEAEGSYPGELQVVQDTTWGEGVQGKLKTQSFNVQFQGTFSQTLSILRGIEGLQTLVAIQDFETRVDDQERPEPVYDRANNRVIQPAQPPLTTSFTLKTLVPLSDAELAEQAAAAAAAEAPAEGEQPPAQ